MNSKKVSNRKSHAEICKLTILIQTVLIFLSVEGGFASIPPHQRVNKMIKDRSISVPYHLAQAREASSRGINSSMLLPKTAKSAQFSRVFSSIFNALAILVQFPDKPGQTSGEYFDTLLFHPSGKTLRKYYQEISYGQMDIITVNLPSSTGWKQVSKNYSYYVDGKNGFGTYPNNSQKLIEEVVALADSIVDFSKYDNDHDGYVDALFIIHAGSGAEYTGSVNDIWSHQWSTYTPQLVDGVNVFTYSIEPEYWSKPGDMTCGVFAHEMAHAVFQLPDLYDYDQNSKGLGRWSLMASGSWNGNLGNSPAHPDAWSRVMMGFAQPTVIDSDIMDMEILPVEDVSSIYKLIPLGSTGNEYFLIENRRKKLFDESLRGEGLLVYHIDENKIGNGGQWYPDLTTNDHYKVALEQADGKWDLERNQNAGDAGDPFPGSTNKTIINTLSIPNSNNYLDGKTHLAVTNIRSIGSTIVANVFGINSSPKIEIRSSTLIMRLAVNDSNNQNINILNFGGEALTYSIQIDSTQGYLFNDDFSILTDLAIIPRNGLIEPSDSQEVVLKLFNNGLTEGNYETTILIQNNDSTRSIMSIPLIIEVVKVIPTQIALLNVLSGWNIISKPLDTDEKLVTDLFQNATSRAFLYKNGHGYLPSDTIESGKAYWMRYSSPEIVTMTGLTKESLKVPVKAGWNMVGAYSVPLPVQAIIQEPHDNVTSSFFSYKKSYISSDTLFPSQGYWVYVKEDGYLLYTNNALESASHKVAAVREDSEDYDRLSIVTADGENKVLFMTRNLSASSMNKNMLPPLPPEGSFDVRFQPQSNNSFGGMLEDFSFPEGKRKDLYIMISSESYPLDFSWQPKMNYDKRITLYEVVDGKDGRSHDLSAATEFQINNEDVKLLHLVIDGVDRLPLKLQLSQNHPNPFNPTTIIKFNLPVASIVNLKIYDIVGNEVHTLINEQTFESGESHIQFNGDNLASGTYFYRLSAKPKITDNNQHAVYTEIKKMILLK